MMRLFIAVSISNEVKEEMINKIPLIRNQYKNGKWVPAENWHVTLLFLGEVSNDKISLVRSAMDESVRGIQPFQLWVEGIGAFPNDINPKILWAGVKGEMETSNILYQKLLQAVDKRGLPYDAKPRYKPHITLSRKIEKRTDYQEIPLQTSEWTVQSLELYESVSEYGGVTYKKIFTQNF